MKTRSIALCAAALAVVVTTGCKKEEKSSATQTTAASAAAAPLAQEDKEFLTKAAQGGQVEVDIAQKALSGASSSDVKSLAQHMLTDHTKANDELRQLAMKKGYELPTVLDDEHRHKVDKLTNLAGNKMDEEYSDDLVDYHEHDIKVFSKAAKDVKDPEIRAWAQKMIPILQAHLAHAKSVDDMIDKKK